MHSATISESIVDVDGLKVSYMVHGSGPTVIFVHGWACDWSTWRFQIPAFSRDHCVIVIDLPGHGRSAGPSKGFSMSLFATAVEAARGEVAADRIALVGHSMGAIVIREYALSYPEHLAGLVAADGPLDVRKFAALPGGRAPMTSAAREGLIKRMFGPQTPKALRTEITKMMLGTSPTTANGAGSAMFNFPIQSGRLIAAPALTIYAGTPLFGRDPLAKEMLPNWESAQIPGTGHFVMMEKPEEFNQLLSGFLHNRADF